jgi:VHL beta domain
MSIRRPLHAILALSLLSAMPVPAFAEDLVWSMTPGDKPTLIFGVPQTDNARFIAICKSPDDITIQVASDVSELANDEEVDVGFRGNRFLHQAAAKVIGVNAENGITGAEFHVKAVDPFWNGMIKQDTVRFGIAGFAPTVMRFGEDREQIQAFLDQCSGAVEQTASRPSADNTVSCDQFSTLKSKTSKQSVIVNFINKTDALRTLMWIDFKGRPQDFGALEPGQKKKIKTFVTHPWMMTDGPGNCQEIYMPQKGDTTFAITGVVANSGGE